jgi:hypothetical protein
MKVSTHSPDGIGNAGTSKRPWMAVKGERFFKAAVWMTEAMAA